MQHRGVRDLEVVPSEIELRVAGLRKVHLLGVGELDLVPRRLDRRIGLRHGADLRSLTHLRRVAMDDLQTITYERDGRIARITLDRPERGNAITLEMPRELAACVEEANLDPAVHVIALAGNGKGFCGGYDLVLSAEQGMDGLSPQ